MGLVYLMLSNYPTTNNMCILCFYKVLYYTSIAAGDATREISIGEKAQLSKCNSDDSFNVINDVEIFL